MSKVKKDDTVKVHYTGKLNDGQVFDSSREREPIECKVGAGQMIPGFEKGGLDMELHQKKEISIKPEEAYGEVKDERFQEIHKSQLPEGTKPKIGMGVAARETE